MHAGGSATDDAEAGIAVRTKGVRWPVYAEMTLRCGSQGHIVYRTDRDAVTVDQERERHRPAFRYSKGFRRDVRWQEYPRCRTCGDRANQPKKTQEAPVPGSAIVFLEDGEDTDAVQVKKANRE